jgi:hypothetical protein
MHLVYMDESGNSGTNLLDHQQPIFVLGALIIEESLWQDLERDLEVAVEQHFPAPRDARFELHANEMRNGKGCFKNVSLDSRLGLWHACMEIAARHDLKFVYRSIAKRRFATWLVDKFGEGVVINPHVVAFPLVAQVINSYLVSLSEDALAIFISDENQDVSPDIEKTIRLLRVTEEDIRLNRIIEKGFFIDSSKSLALQLCDLCTFAARKREEQRNGFRVTPVDEKAVQLLEPLIHRGSESLEDVLAWIEQEQKKGAARD